MSRFSPSLGRDRYYSRERSRSRTRRDYQLKRSHKSSRQNERNKKRSRSRSRNPLPSTSAITKQERLLKHKNDLYSNTNSSKHPTNIIKNGTTKQEIKEETKENKVFDITDLYQLGLESERMLRKDNIVKLPDTNDFCFAKEKERYYFNMYRLIVTARQQIQKLENEIKLLKIKNNAQFIVDCPFCKHKFKTTENRYLPKYLKILHSASTVELIFNDSDHLHEWLLATSLDRDQDGIQVYFPKEGKRKQHITLADVNSSLINQKNSIL